MKILIVSATALEIRPFISRLVPERNQTGPLRNFRSDNHLVDVLVTGIGMLPATFHLGKFLPTGKYDLAVNAGICGSYHEDLPPMTVVEVTEDFPVELGYVEDGRFMDIFTIGLASHGAWPCEEGLLKNRYVFSSPATKDLRKVRGATVNTFGNEPLRIERIRDAFHPDVETMEGAAFLYACLMQQIPNIQLRAVSNYVTENDRSQWKIGEAVTALNAVMEHVVRW